jgi:hypothetical protein
MSDETALARLARANKAANLQAGYLQAFGRIAPYGAVVTYRGGVTRVGCWLRISPVVASSRSAWGFSAGWKQGPYPVTSESRCNQPRPRREESRDEHVPVDLHGRDVGNGGGVNSSQPETSFRGTTSSSRPTSRPASRRNAARGAGSYSRSPRSPRPRRETRRPPRLLPRLRSRRHPHAEGTR